MSKKVEDEDEGQASPLKRPSFDLVKEEIDHMEKPISSGVWKNKLTFRLTDKNKVPYPPNTEYEAWVRILPAGLDKDIVDRMPWLMVKSHFLHGKNRFEVCTADSKSGCVYCDTKVALKKVFLVNVMVMQNDHDPQSENTVKVFELNNTLFEKVYSAMKPGVEGVKKVVPFDPFEGADLHLKGFIKNQNGKSFIDWGGSCFEKYKDKNGVKQVKVTKMGYFKPGGAEGDDPIRVTMTDVEIAEVLGKRLNLAEFGQSSSEDGSGAVKSFTKKPTQSVDDEDEKYPVEKRDAKKPWYEE